jgi:hypothetical protein
VVAPFLHRQALKQDESLPVDQFFPQDTKEVREVAEPEGVLRDASQRRGARNEGVRGV